MLAQAADSAAAGEGVPWWWTVIGSAVVVPLAGVLVAYLRRLLRVEEPTEPAQGAAPPTTPQGATVTQPSPAPVIPPPPDPEIALVATMVDRLYAELTETRAQITKATEVHSAAMADAERRHREAMAEAERRHTESMSGVLERLADRETTIRELRATIRVLTERATPG